MVGMLATLFTRQLLFDGLISGLDLRAAGDGHRARLPRDAGHQLRRRQHGPRRRRPVRPARRPVQRARSGSARVVALAVGTLYGAVIELIVIRRLFNAPRVIVLVATIGVAQLSQVVARGLSRHRRARRPLPDARSAPTYTIGRRPDHRPAARRS